MNGVITRRGRFAVKDIHREEGYVTMKAENG